MRSGVWRGSRYCAQLPHLMPTWFTSKIPKARDSPSFSSVGNVEHDTRAMHALIYPRKERNARRRESSRASWRMIETSAASFRELKPNSTHPVVCIFIFSYAESGTQSMSCQKQRNGWEFDAKCATVLKLFLIHTKNRSLHNETLYWVTSWFVV